MYPTLAGNNPGLSEPIASPLEVDFRPEQWALANLTIGSNRN